eukprot:2609473-Pyramimonas_sp.AAC.1
MSACLSRGRRRACTARPRARRTSATRRSTRATTACITTSCARLHREGEHARPGAGMCRPPQADGETKPVAHREGPPVWD